MGFLMNVSPFSTALSTVTESLTGPEGTGCSGVVAGTVLGACGISDCMGPGMKDTPGNDEKSKSNGFWKLSRGFEKVGNPENTFWKFV